MTNILKPGGLIPSTIGGKARGLMLISSLGVPTPYFVVIPDTWFESICNADALDGEGIPQFDKIKLPESLLLNIKSNFSDSVKYYAVRSSYRDEDAEKTSFAGQFKTRLFVSFTDLEAAIMDVWASCVRSNVATYQKEHRLQQRYFLSIIVQEMLDPEVSGVAFSLNPLTGHRKQKVINAVYGLGEGLVSGDLNADQYIVTNGQIESKIASKDIYYAFDADNNSGVRKMETVSAIKDRPCLTDGQIMEVCQKLGQLQNHFGKYQDIEFAFSNNNLYILQSRPVTSVGALPDTHGQYIVWDNSNIVESYPGLTSPLTFSYIIQLYEKAYRQFVELMGVPKKDIDANADHFANMLGLLNGRVYYNLRSWYKMISMLPGYSINARFMEQMMGVKERFDIEETERRSKFRDYIRIGNMVVSILRNLFTLESQKRVFVQRFDAMQAEIRTIDPESVSADQIMKIYKMQETLLLKIWKAPLVNDFFAMIYFGLLKKKMVGLFGEGTNIHNDLLIGDNTIITTKPAELIAGIVNKIYASEALYDLFKQQDRKGVWNQIYNNQAFSGIKEEVNAYIEQFGDRMVGELKLETKTYKQYPEMFIGILQSYIQHDRKPHDFNYRTGPDVRLAAEQAIKEKLRGKPLAHQTTKHIIKKARQLVSGRENLRFYRTRAFGEARTAFYKIGQIFYSEGLLKEPDDIFMLTKDELFTYIQGTSVNYDLKALVEIRKQQYDVFKNEMTQSERIKTYGIVYQGNSFAQEKSLKEQPDGLKGIGCCKGVVSGKVKIVSKPEDAFDMDGDILVTTSTDPGWVTIFPSIKGILVERGSLLSHAAIVSREMGIPCIVGINGLTSILKPGDYVEMDGGKGIVNIITKDQAETSIL